MMLEGEVEVGRGLEGTAVLAWLLPALLLLLLRLALMLSAAALRGLEMERNTLSEEE